MVKRIISGGQTGADRAGLDFAIKHSIPHGGFCPRDRKAEDGRIPDHYNLEETLQPTYPPRTALNVRYSDGTVIFNPGSVMERGCQLTVELCIQMRKPFYVWSGKNSPRELKSFILSHGIQTLNVAGNRESKYPGIHDFVVEILEKALL